MTQAFNLSQFANNVNSSGQVDVSTGISGTIAIANLPTIPVNKGGTGLTTLTANNVILGNGTTSPTFVAPSSLGNLLTSNGTTWVSSPAPFLGKSNQTYQDLTASRNNGTTYTNNTGAPIYVIIMGRDNVGQGLNLNITIAGVAFPTTGAPSGAYLFYFPFIVPVGASYSASWNAAAVLGNWFELR